MAREPHVRTHNVIQLTLITLSLLSELGEVDRVLTRLDSGHLGNHTSSARGKDAFDASNSL